MRVQTVIIRVNIKRDIEKEKKITKRISKNSFKVEKFNIQIFFIGFYQGMIEPLRLIFFVILLLARFPRGADIRTTY